MKASKHLIMLMVMMAVLLCFPSLSFSRAEERKEVSYNLTQDGKVYLENIAGDISVTGWDRNSVRIEAVKKSRRARDLDDISIDIHQYDDDSIRIITRRENSYGLFGSARGAVHYKLFIPDQAQIRIKTISGDVDARGVGGFLNVSTVSGEVEVISAVNGIKCKTVSGDIDLQDITGNAELKTVSGEISIDGINGSVVADTVSGDIELDGLLNAEEVVLDTTSGEIELYGEVSPGGVYEIDSFSGNIEMIVPADSNFELHTKTTSGRINIDFPHIMTRKVSRKRIQGVVGKGGAHINIKTFSGNVDMKER